MTETSPFRYDTVFKHFKAGEFADQSFLMATLHAVRLNLQQTLSISPEISLTDFVKQQWAISNKIEYPRSYISLTNFEILRDRGNPLSMRKSGIPATIADATGNLIKTAKVFPVQLSLELHYFDSDMQRAINFVENISVLIASHSCVIAITVQGLYNFQSRLDFDYSISIPTITLDNTTDSGSMELSFPFKVDSYIGKIETVTRAYSLAGSTERSEPRVFVE